MVRNPFIIITFAKERILCFYKDMRKQTIDNYRLTSMEEPTDEVLAQLMHEAATDAREANARATARFFNEIRMSSSAIR